MVPSLGDDQTSATPLPTHNNLRQAGGFATPSSERVCFYTRIHSRVDRIYADATGHIPGQFKGYCLAQANPVSTIDSGHAQNTSILGRRLLKHPR